MALCQATLRIGRRFKTGAEPYPAGGTHDLTSVVLFLVQLETFFAFFCFFAARLSFRFFCGRFFSDFPPLSLLATAAPVV